VTIFRVWFQIILRLILNNMMLTKSILIVRATLKTSSFI